MSVYQYYEFQAIDRPLDQADREALRAISSRAKITATSFINHYNWGDFGGDPRMIVERWFDLHLYFADWGTRRLMMRLPARLLDVEEAGRFLGEVEWAEIQQAGDSLILDIYRDEEEPEYGWHDGEDDSEWLAALAPLRADIISGDLTLLYILWLTAVEDGSIPDGEVEPLPGIGPLTGALDAFVTFFGIDPDLAQAAVTEDRPGKEMSRDDLREALVGISDSEKTDLLVRLVEGDGHLAAELKARLRGPSGAPLAPRRSVGALRARAGEIAAARERAEAERLKAERIRQAQLAAAAQRARLKDLKRRGDAVWEEIETEIGRRNPAGYDRAASLLFDLQALAAETGGQDDFARRVASIRSRHEGKLKFTERLTRLGL